MLQFGLCLLIHFLFIGLLVTTACQLFACTGGTCWL